MVECQEAFSQGNPWPKAAGFSYAKIHLAVSGKPKAAPCLMGNAARQGSERQLQRTIISIHKQHSPVNPHKPQQPSTAAKTVRRTRSEITDTGRKPEKTICQRGGRQAKPPSHDRISERERSPMLNRSRRGPPVGGPEKRQANPTQKMPLPADPEGAIVLR